MDERCLRCAGVALTRLPSPQEIAFFQCPQCRREFARRPGRALTYRWGHPISLMLYPIMFSREPLTEVPRVAQLLKNSPELDWNAAVEEVRLELAAPTQSVSDIVECQAGETQLREYLAAMCASGDAAPRIA